MESELIIIILGVAVFLGAVIWAFARRKDSGEVDADSSSVMLQNQLNELSRSLNDLSRNMDEKLGESSKQMYETMRAQSGESNRAIRDVTERLARLDETGKQMLNVSEQVQSLQDILKNPKQRGVLGEFYLESLLQNVMPEGNYKIQYTFEDGTIVDAAVFVKDKIIPVDSKFSVESYNRLVETKDPALREELEKQLRNDLKKRIDETAKYVKPEEGTMDFAFMFIPHEAIYYDLLVSQVGAATAKMNMRDLIEYAFRDKRVIIVSPTSFLAYLQTVMQGLKALQIEESAQYIRKRVEDLGRHLANHEQYMQSLGKSLDTTVNHYNRAHKELGKVDKDVTRITGETPGIEPLSVDKTAKELEE